MPYGEVPIQRASAGLQPIVRVAYVLVWACFEHLINSHAIHKNPQRRLVFIMDDVEAHLHLRRQRTIVPVLAPPEKLARRGSAQEIGPIRASWIVSFDGDPQYLLPPIPVDGSSGCAVQQTINGQQLNRAGTSPSADEVLRGGLEDLRQALGW